MFIAEIYRSTQGEGLLTGIPSVFVRTSGCNLRCWYCDTPYASWDPEGQDLSIDEIVAQIEEWSPRHVVLTGGEPMLLAELIPLCERLRQLGRHLTIETAGTLDLPVACDLMSISPKLARSVPSRGEHPHWNRRHERTRYRPRVIRRLIREYAYQLKFVIDCREEFGELEEYLAEFPEIDRGRVLLMPQGTDQVELDARAEWLRAYCLEHGYVFCPRKQIEWFGSVRGT